MTRQQDSGNVGGGGAAWCGSIQQAHLKAVAHTIVSIAGLFISSVRHVLLSEMFLPVVAGSICGRQAGRQACRHAGIYSEGILVLRAHARLLGAVCCLLVQIAAGAAAADWSIGCTLVSLGPSPLHNGRILTYLSGNILQMFRFTVLIFLTVFCKSWDFFHGFGSF